MTIAPEARTCAAELNVKDLAIGHNGKTLLKHLTFSVPAGSSLAIVGESGCGQKYAADDAGRSPAGARR